MTLTLVATLSETTCAALMANYPFGTHSVDNDGGIAPSAAWSRSPPITFSTALRIVRTAYTAGKFNKSEYAVQGRNFL